MMVVTIAATATAIMPSVISITIANTIRIAIGSGSRSGIRVSIRTRISIRATGKPTLPPPRRADPLGPDRLDDLVILTPPSHPNRTAGDLVHSDRRRSIEPDGRSRTTRRRRRTQSVADTSFERVADLLATIDRHEPHPILGDVSARRIRATHGALPDAGLHEIDEGGK